ncbi:MAG: Rrf2 family transcriptional regulator [Verrucomicrobiae bacterium]|nr:Rrf2 family transcriptional regulator [Verrucomicrobiae bacterium]
MKLSKRSEYALRALIDVGMAEQFGRPKLQISEIAEKENIPVKYLEHLMLTLRNSGFLVSKRGKDGGYSLGKPAEAIKIGQVIRLLDGPLAPISCVSQTAYQKCNCPDEAHCGLRMLMLDVRNSIANILDNHSLAEIVEITLRKIKKDKAAQPFKL